MATQPLRKASPTARLARREKRTDPPLNAGGFDEKPRSAAEQAFGVEIGEVASQVIVGDDDPERPGAARPATRREAPHRRGDRLDSRRADVADANDLKLRLRESRDRLGTGPLRFPTALWIVETRSRDDEAVSFQ